MVQYGFVCIFAKICSDVSGSKLVYQNISLKHT